MNEKEYVYLKWKCRECGDIVISNKFRHHQMDFCKCGKCGVDLETYQLRMLGFPDKLERINYNFFDELVIGMKEQGLMDFVDIDDGRKYINLTDVLFIQKIENDILNRLKKQKEVLK